MIGAPIGTDAFLKDIMTTQAAMGEAAQLLRTPFKDGACAGQLPDHAAAVDIYQISVPAAHTSAENMTIPALRQIPMTSWIVGTMTSVIARKEAAMVGLANPAEVVRVTCGSY